MKLKKKITGPKEKVALEKELRIELRCFPICETWLKKLKEPGQSDLLFLSYLVWKKSFYIVNCGGPLAYIGFLAPAKLS